MAAERPPVADPKVGLAAPNSPLAPQCSRGPIYSAALKPVRFPIRDQEGKISSGLIPSRARALGIAPSSIRLGSLGGTVKITLWAVLPLCALPFPFPHQTLADLVFATLRPPVHVPDVSIFGS